MFKVGDEVVCVNNKQSPAITYWNAPESGKVYVVSGVGLSKQFSSQVNIWLEGHKNRHRGNGEDYGFNAARFRKVQRKNSRLTLEAFFTVPGGFEEPKRAPAKKKTDA